MLIVPFPISTTNVLIFFLIDAPAIWAIQRGLLASQAYYLYKRASAGRTVPLARSRIPIVGGELLRGVSRWPSAFVFVNIGVLVCLCLATLGVDADREAQWERASFTNVTTLAMPNSRELNTTIFPYTQGVQKYVTLPLSFRDTVQENVTCRTRNTTHADYWPVVFNASHFGPNSKSNAWFADNASCQANATGNKPMLTTSCVPLETEEPCSLDKMSSLVSVGAKIDVVEERINGLADNISSLEWNATLDMSSITASKDGLPAIVFAYSYFGSRRSDFLVLINDSSSDSWLFAFGGNVTDVDIMDPSKKKEYSMTPPLRLSPHGSASVEYIILALRTNIDVSSLMFRVYISDEQNTLSTFSLFESILLKIYRGVPLPSSHEAFVRKSDKDVTSIDFRGTVLYILIIALSIVLFPMKELLAFFLVRRGKLREADLLIYEYDQLSKEKRAATERLEGVPLTGEFSTIQISASEEEVVDDGMPAEGWT